MKRVLYAVMVFFGSIAIALRGFRDYSPLTEGWWHVYSRWIAQGKIPYKDFELLVPPGYPLLLRLISMMFGEQFLVLRLIGSLQIGLIGFFVWVLTRRVADDKYAAFISLASIAYLCSGTAFISYDYVYTALLLLLGSLSLALHLELEKVVNERRMKLGWTLVGVLAGLSLLIKQTQGAASICAAIGVVVLSNLRSRSIVYSKLAFFSVGFCISWVPVLAWLGLNGVTPVEFVQEMSASQGPKGSINEVLFSWIWDVFKWPQPIGILQSVAPFLLIAVIGRWYSPKEVSEPGQTKLIGIVTVVFMAVTWYSNWDSIGQFGSVFNFAWQEFILNATVGSWIACAFYLLSCAREREKRKTALLLSLVVAATVWSCAMSAGITEIGAFLSVAIALGALVDYGRKSVAVSLVAMIMVISISSGSWWKYEGLPRYSWWGYSTVSPEVVKARSSKGLTKGLLWDASALEAFEKTQEVLSRAKSCGGEVVVFPHVPLFQLDANLLPGGRLATYWYDFSTQDEIQLEVARLKRVKISAIVLLELPDTVVEGHELLFNDGAPLVHRQIYDFLSKIGPGSMTDVIQAPVGPDTFWHVFADNCSATS